MTFGGKVCLFKLQKGSKIYLLSKMYIFSENIQKSKIFKKSKKNLLVSKMEQNPFSCSIGIWNYHLTPSKSESRIFLWPYASPLCIWWQSEETLTDKNPVRNKIRFLKDCLGLILKIKINEKPMRKFCCFKLQKDNKSE